MTAIAIDGPAGAGKSTIAREVARELGFIYVDTGALYRAVGLYCLRQGVDTRDADAVLAQLPKIRVELKHVKGEQRVYLNGEDVSQAIRVNEASMAASHVSSVQGVRDFLFDLQRSIARSTNVVMDGRDIGTVVLPDAQVKIFLTATPEDRAARRHAQLLNRGIEVDYQQLLAEVQERDYNDSNRAAAPLRQADDAYRIDTTGNTFAQSVALIIKFVKEKLQ